MKSPDRNRRIQWTQGTRQNQILAGTFTAAGLIIGSIYLVGIGRGIPLDHLTGDPAMITHTPLHIGILSNIGVMLWAAAAACAFLGAALQSKDPQKSRFLFFSGLFSAFLGADDLLSIHEHLLPHTLHIPEALGVFGYVLLFGFFIYIFIRLILKETDYTLLAVSLLFFGLSIVTRIVPLNVNGQAAFVKDSLKFLGIVYWLVYFFWTTIRFSQKGLQIPVNSSGDKPGNAPG